MAIHGNQNGSIDLNFKEDVDKGLSAPFKYLLSRYFYDARGDKLFQDIMHMPEYYLTDAEHEIFSEQGTDILEAVQHNGSGFDLVEFGAGDGLKTRVLIKRMVEAKADFRYLPIDISEDVLRALKFDLSKEFPDLEVIPEHAEYFNALQNISKRTARTKLVLFLGSSIGNFAEDRTVSFLNVLNDKLNTGDRVMIGFDLKKDPETILKAYNDEAGITASFNMNVLRRINRELGGNFDLEKFRHFPTYNPESGFARSYLVSADKQEVFIEALNKAFAFEKGECIHTEISRKYSISQVEKLLTDNGFSIQKHFIDKRGYYVDTLAKKEKS